MDEYFTILSFVLALGAGYLLGSVPFASMVARFRGIDIFSTGKRTAGTANVFWNVGYGAGIAVLAGDVAKGAAPVLVAWLLGLPWQVGLLAGGAAVLGHWKSVFSGFRGGDGMATVVGVALALQPELTTLGLVVGTGVLLAVWRLPGRSAWALSTCFFTMALVSQYYQVDRGMVTWLAALAALVLWHNLRSHRHRTAHFAAEVPLELGVETGDDPVATENGRA